MPRRLATRLILALTAIVAVVGVGVGYVDARNQEQRILGQMVIGVDQLSRSITGATWHAMLADNRQSAYEVMQSIGRTEGIESIRFFNKEGKVTFSTEPDALEQVDKRAEACFMCHSAEEPLHRLDVPGRTRIYEGPDGRRRMAMVTPIYNEPACSNAACHAHPADQTVLGVLDVGLDLSPVDAGIARMELRAAATTIAEIGIIGLFIVLVTRRWVQQPIGRLIRATKAVGGMDLDHPIDVGRSGQINEIADLTESFEVMRTRLKTTLAALQASAEDLEQKVEERSRQLQVAQSRLVLTDRLSSLGQLAASVAHEINNPISGILNLSMLLERILTEDGIPAGREGDFARHLAQISEETARVGRIVSGLLTFSRRSPPTAAEADCNAIVRNTLTLVSHKLQLTGVKVELELDPTLPPIPCDRSQIQQVVMNLVMNGAEAMPDGGPLVVSTRRDPELQQARLRVSDSGTGISPENLARIYDPFFTTKEEGKGVGLGLAVVYGIVEAHGGHLDVDSRPGEGTTFTVCLPLERPQGELPDEDARPEEAAAC